MDEILMLTDHAEDMHAVKFAHRFASQNGKQLVVAQINKFDPIRLLNLEPVMRYGGRQKDSTDNQNTHSKFNGEHFHPPITTFDVTDYDDNTLAAYICKKGYTMVISKPGVSHFNLQAIVNQINCPVLLLPDNLSNQDVKRMVYLTDLRFCQRHVIAYLDKFERSSVLLAHICEKGLPDLAPSYGDQLFHDTIRHHAAGSEIFFSHIKETNTEKMVDTLVNTMKTDVLVCLSKRTHFNQLLGEELPKRLPDHISVPMLVFPY